LRCAPVEIKVPLGALRRNLKRGSFNDADDVDGRVIFNIRQNRYRLVTIIHYSREKDGRITEGHIYVRSFLTHNE
jgi:mRNA interferase HigB